MWATKYRPSTLDGVLGQDYVKQVLRGRLQKNTKESHGWMLVGPYGAGKTTILRILAKSLACPTPSPSGEACHKCQSCQAIDADASLNYREIDAASYSKADDIRDLVVEAKLSPTGDSPNRVIALDEAHVMSKTAQNVLLKTLEETPPTTHIILITTDPQNLLPTIKSRCLTLELSPVEKTHVVNHLAQICKLEEIDYETEALDIIVAQKYGHVRDALTLAETISLAGPLTLENVKKHFKLDLDERTSSIILSTKTEWDKALLNVETLLESSAPEDVWKSAMRVVKNAELARLSPNRVTMHNLKPLIETYGERLKFAAEWIMVSGERFSIRTVSDLLVGLSFIKDKLGVGVERKTNPNRNMGRPARFKIDNDSLEKTINESDMINQLNLTRED